jgi:hypothetical protein
MRAQISKSLSGDPDGEAKEWAAKFYVENLLSTPEIAAILPLCKRCHDAFHNAAGGAVRMAIGPFFSNTNEVRDFPVSSEYPVAA